MPALPSRAFVALVAALAASLPTPALAWGKTGHRVVAQIADARLTARAHRAVTAILGVETLAEASNWPDTMRSDPAPYWQRESTPWHYVTVPSGKTYAQAGAPPEGDAITALARFAATLRDKRASIAERQAALRFVVHLVGDLHQPLHAGNGSDRGGNDRQVTFFGRATNLHTVWDSALVDEQQLSFTEMATWLGARITRAQARDWAAAAPETWVAESSALRDQIYPAADERALSYRYVYENTPRVERQLEKGGVRLAAYLNRLFAEAR
ncbi:S1/P1 nuclease [Sphingomonas sp. BK235]|uniref:S1/P1 nuclease n=1 Tax=Sphingomonas sp. BK235 TaxID=2512131 RepID=UPI00104DB35B|nr:S1/P1 nuclease [Sphingomonas sp. BK235]TCP35672.1 S1/P1 nuclease [Sphingomonas sp. BK235]